MNQVTIEINPEKYTIKVTVEGKIVSERTTILTSYGAEGEKPGDIYDDVDGKLTEAIDDIDMDLYGIARALQDVG